MTSSALSFLSGIKRGKTPPGSPGGENAAPPVDHVVTDSTQGDDSATLQRNQACAKKPPIATVTKRAEGIVPERSRIASSFLLGISLSARGNTELDEALSNTVAVEGGLIRGSNLEKEPLLFGLDEGSVKNPKVVIDSKARTRRQVMARLARHPGGGMRCVWSSGTTFLGVSSLLRVGAVADIDTRAEMVTSHQFSAMSRLKELVAKEPRSYFHLLSCPDPLTKKREAERDNGNAASALAPQSNSSIAVVSAGPSEDTTSYDPLVVDDPDIQGKGKTVTPLQGYLATFIPYTAPSILKKEINDQFRRRNSWAPEGLTLSKIRKVKGDLLEIRRAIDVDYSTVALSFVYFEKLVLMSYVQKENRRVVAAACLYIAFKLNDPACPRLQKELISKIEEELDVSKEELHEAEFPVIVALSFCLRVPTSEVWPHIVRILNDEGLSPEEAYAVEALADLEVGK